MTFPYIMENNKCLKPPTRMIEMLKTKHEKLLKNVSQLISKGENQNELKPRNG